MNYFFHVLFLLLSTDFILVCVLGTEVVILSLGVLYLHKAGNLTQYELFVVSMGLRFLPV